jgi:ribosomal protein S18 acetylase RimI-like enzyme
MKKFTEADVEICSLDAEEEECRFEAASRVFCVGGQRWFTPPTLRALTLIAGVAIAVTPDGEVVGGLVTTEWTPTDTFYVNQFLKPERQLSSDPPILHLSDASVLPEWRRRGVASRLIETAIEKARYCGDQPFTRIIAYCRFPTNREPVGTSWNLLRRPRFGFKSLAIIGGYYADADPHNDPTSWCCSSCEEMGLWRCSCQSRVEILDRSKILLDRSKEEDDR